MSYFLQFQDREETILSFSNLYLYYYIMFFFMKKIIKHSPNIKTVQLLKLFICFSERLKYSSSNEHHMEYFHVVTGYHVAGVHGENITLS